MDAEEQMSQALACRWGRHRWTWTLAEDTRDLGDQPLRCHRCGTSREPRKRAACQVGFHRWTRVVSPEGWDHRTCIFCRHRRDTRGGVPWSTGAQSGTGGPDITGSAFDMGGFDGGGGDGGD